MSCTMCMLNLLVVIPSFGQHNWTASWCQMPAPDEHVGEIKLTHDLALFGITLPFIHMNVHAFQVTQSWRHCLCIGTCLNWHGNKALLLNKMSNTKWNCEANIVVFTLWIPAAWFYDLNAALTKLLGHLRQHDLLPLLTLGNIQILNTT